MVRLPIILKPGSDARGINTDSKIYLHLNVKKLKLRVIKYKFNRCNI